MVIFTICSFDDTAKIKGTDSNPRKKKGIKQDFGGKRKRSKFFFLTTVGIGFRYGVKVI